MVVQIYSLSEWNVHVSTELQSYIRHGFQASSSSSSHDEDVDDDLNATTATTNTTNMMIMTISPPLPQLKQQQQRRIPFSISQWLHQAIKVSPSVTICRYNYCHPSFVRLLPNDDCRTISSSSSFVSDTDRLREKQQQQQQQQEQHRKEHELFIQRKVQSSIQDWLRHRIHHHRSEENGNFDNHQNNDDDDDDDDYDTASNIPPSSNSQHHHDDDDDDETTAKNDDYIVIVQPHEVLSDTISIQILLKSSLKTTTTTTTTTSKTSAKVPNGHNNEHQYLMYNSRGPPPLNTWYHHIHNDADTKASAQLLQECLQRPLSTNPQQSIAMDGNTDTNNDIIHIDPAHHQLSPPPPLPSTTTTTTTTKQQQQPSHQFYWRKEQHWPPYPYGVVIVDRICGEAILRGADIYPTTGILCTDTYIVPHTPVAIYVDMTCSSSSSSSSTTMTTASREKHSNNNTKPPKTKKVSRGVTLQEYSTSTTDLRTVIFIGIGIATCTRSEIFTKDIMTTKNTSSSSNTSITSTTATTTTAAAIRMIQIATPTPLYLLPPTNEIFSNVNDKIVVQNLPSLLVAHTLLDDTTKRTINDNETIASNNSNTKEREGDDDDDKDDNEIEWILDMCCAPGGKTSHLASLILHPSKNGPPNRNDITNPLHHHNVRRRITSKIIACDKSQIKICHVRDTLQRLHCDDMVIPIVLDTTKCVVEGMHSSLLKIVDDAEIDTNTNLRRINGFPPESFHRILLDPPCSAWGLRPKLSIVQTTIEQLQSICSYQQQFIQSAIRLLKPGGVMTYSTCTINTGENETMVRYILDQYPMMELLPIHTTSIGGPGWIGFGLNDDECQCVRRFDPTNTTLDDSIGFFVAKFRKRI